MKDYLELEGFDVNSPRQTIKTAFQVQLISDGHTWIDVLEKRNFILHTYNEKVADKVKKLIIDKYYDMIKDLHDSLEELT